jgi:hypothetical protein
VAETPTQSHTNLGDAINAVDNLIDFSHATIDAPEKMALRAASPMNKQGD